MKWISVKERLPPSNTLVLTFEEGWGYDICSYNDATQLRERFELLDRAATRGWLLSTSDLALLIGLEPGSLVRHQELSRWGFTFVKCVERTGREVNWAVTHPRTDPKQLEG